MKKLATIAIALLAFGATAAPAEAAPPAKPSRVDSGWGCGGAC